MRSTCHLRCSLVDLCLSGPPTTMVTGTASCRLLDPPEIAPFDDLLSQVVAAAT